MTSPILLTGGTGTLGRLVLPLLRETGRPVRVLSRSVHEAADGVEYVRSVHEAADGVEYVAGDLATGDGISTAVTGVETVLHCAGSAKGDEQKARTLVHAAKTAGVGHLVDISVVGADRIPVRSGIDRALFGYFAAQLGTERVIAESGIPWTTLRATQFHDFVLNAAQQATRLPVAMSFAGVRFQPVDAAEVAERLVELALGEPAGLVPDLAGPEVHDMKYLLRSYLEAAHKRRLIVPVRPPGAAGKAFRAGANLAPDRAVGRRTWEDFLSDRVG
ncbi:MAG TPA: NAD(P)-binding oxidoreductase [Mycobacteriales bacterium]|nr:NAD(P)-binding oxidoreductase [Mycobacteriales bacterium]